MQGVASTLLSATSSYGKQRVQHTGYTPGLSGCARCHFHAWSPKIQDYCWSGCEWSTIDSGVLIDQQSHVNYVEYRRAPKFASSNNLEPMISAAWELMVWSGLTCSQPGNMLNSFLLTLRSFGTDQCSNHISWFFCRRSPTEMAFFSAIKAADIAGKKYKNQKGSALQECDLHGFTSVYQIK